MTSKRQVQFFPNHAKSVVPRDLKLVKYALENKLMNEFGEIQLDFGIAWTFHLEQLRKMGLIDPHYGFNFNLEEDLKIALRRVRKRFIQLNPWRVQESGNFFQRASYQKHQDLFKQFIKKRIRNNDENDVCSIQKQIKRLIAEMDDLDKVENMSGIQLSPQQKIKIQTQRQEMTQKLEQLMNEEGKLVQESSFDISADICNNYLSFDDDDNFNCPPPVISGLEQNELSNLDNSSICAIDGDNNKERKAISLSLTPDIIQIQQNTNNKRKRKRGEVFDEIDDASFHSNNKRIKLHNDENKNEIKLDAERIAAAHNHMKSDRINKEKNTLKVDFYDEVNETFRKIDKKMDETHKEENEKWEKLFELFSNMNNSIKLLTQQLNTINNNENIETGDIADIGNPTTTLSMANNNNNNNNPVDGLIVNNGSFNIDQVQQRYEL